VWVFFRPPIALILMCLAILIGFWPLIRAVRDRMRRPLRAAPRA